MLSLKIFCIQFDIRMSSGNLKTNESFDKISTTSRSSASSGSNDSNPDKKKRQNRLYKYIIIFTSLAIIFGGGGYQAYMYIPQLTLKNPEFNFHVYCPVFYQLNYSLHTDRFQQLKGILPGRSYLQRILVEDRDELNRTYAIVLQNGYDLNTNKTQAKSVRIRYCAFVRPWNGTCEANGLPVCTNPGPSFDVQQYKQISVVWINNVITDKSYEQAVFEALKKKELEDSNQCYSNNASLPPNELCQKSGKTEEWIGKTYLDPTDYGVSIDAHKKYKTDTKNFAMSAHIHGLEVRPAFDGNPLSWIDNKKNQGVGYFSAEEDYFNCFNSKNSSILLKYFGVTNNQPYKINVYKNVQSPGSLWFHDHTMGVTSFNVGAGLHSFYLIRGKKQNPQNKNPGQIFQCQLPSGEYEKLIFMYRGMNQSSLQSNCSLSCKNTESEICYSCLMNGSSLLKNIYEKPLTKNSLYRFRILNGDFDTKYKIQFFWNSTTGPKQINFTVIGTDSSLNSRPVRNVSNVSLGPGERVDILINFAEVKTLKVFALTNTINVTSGNINTYPLRQFNLTDSPGDNNTIIFTKLLVPYINLTSDVQQSQIAVKRMRPLVWSNSGGATFGINGHLRFHTGASQNPTIGTIEDWYFINTIPFEHPIHIHLIQFQIISFHSLRLLDPKDNGFGTCTYYLIDFFKTNAKNGSTKFNQNNTVICSKILSLSKIEYLQLFSDFKNENHPKNSNNTISGIDVMSTCNCNKNQCDNYGFNKCLDIKYNCSLKHPNYVNGIRYKYVCNEQQVPNYLQGGWKDQVMVPTFNVVRIRIRWASTDLQDRVSKNNGNWKNATDVYNAGGYFHLSEDTLVEFPGYIYHCHILHHEDNEMMRPIMLLPSNDTTANWSDSYLIINKNLDKYKREDLRRRRLL